MPSVSKIGAVPIRVIIVVVVESIRRITIVIWIIIVIRIVIVKAGSYVTDTTAKCEQQASKEK